MNTLRLPTLRKFRTPVLVLAVFLALAAAAIVADGLNDHMANADIIVVPGNEIAPDGSPSPRLKARLDVALQLYMERRAPVVFVSGGIGKEGHDEAASMAGYLIKNGVPASAVVRDPLGVNTAATGANASRFLHAHGQTSALVATQYFHVARTTLALERNGVRVAGTAHARYVEIRDVFSIARETLAYAAYYVKL
jgi:vancomycin permeability regulator SanA